MQVKIIESRNLAIKEIKKYLPANPISCEIGFFKGEFSKVIVDVLESKKHIVIDTFCDIRVISGDKDGNNLQYQNMILMENYSKSLGFKTIKGTSDNLKSIEEEVNFIYIDADHSYEWVLKDLNNAIKKVKNGIIGGHDYSESKFEGCFNAVNDFCKSYNLKIDIITNDGCPSYFIRI